MLMSSRGCAGWPLARVCEWSLTVGFSVWVFPCGQQKEAGLRHWADSLSAPSRGGFLQTLCWWLGWFRFRCQTGSLWTDSNVEQFFRQARLQPCCWGHCQHPASPQNYCLSWKIKQELTTTRVRPWEEQGLHKRSQMVRVGCALPLCWPPSLGWCFSSGRAAQSLLLTQCHFSARPGRKCKKN